MFCTMIGYKKDNELIMIDIPDVTPALTSLKTDSQTGLEQ